LSFHAKSSVRKTGSARTRGADEAIAGIGPAVLRAAGRAAIHGRIRCAVAVTGFRKTSIQMAIMHITLLNARAGSSRSSRRARRACGRDGTITGRTAGRRERRCGTCGGQRQRRIGVTSPLRTVRGGDFYAALPLIGRRRARAKTLIVCRRYRLAFASVRARGRGRRRRGDIGSAAASRGLRASAARRIIIPVGRPRGKKSTLGLDRLTLILAFVPNGTAIDSISADRDRRARESARRGYENGENRDQTREKKFRQFLRMEDRKHVPSHFARMAFRART
jgi:hypothetical protein